MTHSSFLLATEVVSSMHKFAVYRYRMKLHVLSVMLYTSIARLCFYVCFHVFRDNQVGKYFLCFLTRVMTPSPENVHLHDDCQKPWPVWQETDLCVCVHFNHSQFNKSWIEVSMLVALWPWEMVCYVRQLFVCSHVSLYAGAFLESCCTEAFCQ